MRKLRFLAIVALFSFATVSFAQNLPSAEKLMSDAKRESRLVVWDNFSLRTESRKSVWVIFHASW